MLPGGVEFRGVPMMVGFDCHRLSPGPRGSSTVGHGRGGCVVYKPDGKETARCTSACRQGFWAAAVSPAAIPLVSTFRGLIRQVDKHKSLLAIWLHRVGEGGFLVAPTFSVASF